MPTYGYNLFLTHPPPQVTPVHAYEFLTSELAACSTPPSRDNQRKASSLLYVISSLNTVMKMRFEPRSCDSRPRCLAHKKIAWTLGASARVKSQSSKLPEHKKLLSLLSKTIGTFLRAQYRRIFALKNLESTTIP